MKKFSGFSYFTIGEKYNYENSKNKIEVVYRPFENLIYKLNDKLMFLNMPICLKTYIGNKNGLDMYNKKAINNLTKYVDIEIVYFNINNPSDEISEFKYKRLKYVYSKDYIQMIFCVSKQTGTRIDIIDTVLHYVNNWNITEFYNDIDNGINYSKIGFNKKTNKYYALGFRGISMFGIGSVVNIDSVAFRANNFEDYLKNLLSFHERDVGKIDKKISSIVIWNSTNPSKKDYYEIPDEEELFKNKGAWKARTHKDAKKMASDYLFNIG